MMTDDDLRQELIRLEPFEGRVSWMYQDNAPEPNVTTGVGFLLSNVDAALQLPWHHALDGLPASRQEVAGDYFRVHAMVGGLLAVSYRGPLRLASDDIDAEGFRRLRTMLARLPKVFPGFDGFPKGIQQCLLDLAWNCGLAAPKGLAGWSRLRAACNQEPPNFVSGAKECMTANPNHNPMRDARNAWRAKCFLDAARTV